MEKFRTLELAIEFYELVERSNVRGNLRLQLMRASSSISLNLAEGNAKRSIPEKRRFFQTAYGSLKECQVIFRLAKVKDPRLLDTADKLGAWLFKLLNSNIKSQKFGSEDNQKI